MPTPPKSNKRSAWARQIRNAAEALCRDAGKAARASTYVVSDALLDGRGLFPAGNPTWRIACYSTPTTTTVYLNISGDDEMPNGLRATRVFVFHKQLDRPTVFRQGAWEQWVTATHERVAEEQADRARTYQWREDYTDEDATDFEEVDDAALFDLVGEVAA